MPRYMLAFLCVTFLACCVKVSELCSCALVHPQQHFCDSDFVILVRIKHQKVFNEVKVYKARIRKSFKMSEKAEVALKSGRLLTPNGSSVCESDLTPGKLYVLSGKVKFLKARINLCNMAYPWKELSRKQKKGLKMMYRQGCTCKISRCYGQNCLKRKNSCQWDTSSPESRRCYEKEGICLASPSKVCRWARSAALAKCQPKSYLPFHDGLGKKFVQ